MKVLEKNIYKDYIVSIYENLMKDDIDSVRQRALEATGNIIGIFSKSEMRERVVNLLKNVD